MTPDTDKLERMLRNVKPRGISPSRLDSIATTLANRPTDTAYRRIWPRFWTVTAAAAAVATIFMIGLCILQERDKEPARIPSRPVYIPHISQVTIMPREDLGRFVSDSGTPVEAFRYRIVEKRAWRRSDRERSVETAVPIEAVVWVESPVY